MATRDEKGRFKATKPADKKKGGPTPLDVQPRAPIFKSVYETQRSVIRLTANVLINSDIAYRRDYTLQRMMRHDPDVMGPLMQRQMAVALLDWNLVPDDPEDKEAEELAATMTRGLKRMRRWHDFLRHLQEAVWYGPSGANVIYAMTGDDDLPVIPHNWRPYHPDSITYTDEGAPALRVSHHYDGDTVPTENGRARILTEEERTASVLHVFMPQGADFRDIYESRYLYAGRGLRDIVWFQWLLKQTALQLWSTYVERYSMGTRIGRYPHGDPAGQAAMEEILQNMIADVTVLLPRVADDPDAFSIEIAEPNAQASSIYSELIGGYLGGAIKELIIGQSATTEATATGLGSSVGDQHAETFNRIIKFDAGALADTLTEQLIAPYQRMVAPESTSRIRFEFALDDVDPESFMAGAEKAWSMGVAIPVRQIRQRLGLDDPEPGEDVVQQNPAAAGGPGGPGGGDPFGGLFGDEPGGPEGPQGGPAGEGPDAPAEGEGGETKEPPPGSDAFARARAWLKENHGFREEDHPRKSDGKFAPKGAGEAGGGGDGSDPTETLTVSEQAYPGIEEALAAGRAVAGAVMTTQGQDTGWDFEEQREALAEARARSIARVTAGFREADLDGTDTDRLVLAKEVKRSLILGHADPSVYGHKIRRRILMQIEGMDATLSPAEKIAEARRVMAVEYEAHDERVAAGRGGFTADGVYHDPATTKDVVALFDEWDCRYNFHDDPKLVDGEGKRLELDPRVHQTVARRASAMQLTAQAWAAENGIEEPVEFHLSDIRTEDGTERLTNYAALVTDNGTTMVFRRRTLMTMDQRWKSAVLDEGEVPMGFGGPGSMGGGRYNLDVYSGGHAGGNILSHELGHVLHGHLTHLARQESRRRGEPYPDKKIPGTWLFQIEDDRAPMGSTQRRLDALHGMMIGAKGNYYDDSRSKAYYWNKLSKAGLDLTTGEMKNGKELAAAINADIGEYAARYPWEFIAEASAIKQEGGQLSDRMEALWNAMKLPAVEPMAVGTNRTGIEEKARKRGRASRLKGSHLDNLAVDNPERVSALLRETNFSWKDRVGSTDASRMAAIRKAGFTRLGDNSPSASDDEAKNARLGQGLQRVMAEGYSPKVEVTASVAIAEMRKAHQYGGVVHAEDYADKEGFVHAIAKTLDGKRVYSLDVTTSNLMDNSWLVTDDGLVMGSSAGVLGMGKHQKALLGNEYEVGPGNTSKLADGYAPLNVARAFQSAVVDSATNGDLAGRLMWDSLCGQAQDDSSADLMWSKVHGKAGLFKEWTTWSENAMDGTPTVRPMQAMAQLYAHAKMGGHVPVKWRRLYQQSMGKSAPALPKWSPKRS